MEAVSEAIRVLDDDDDEDRVLKGAEEWGSMISGFPGSDGSRMNFIAGSPWFDVYGIDSGWGSA